MDLPFLELERPWALAALGLAVLVLWRARRSGAAPALYSGTLEVWRRVGAATPERGRSGRRLPPAVRWTLGALVLACLAAAGVRAPQAAGQRTWTLLVDTSPSMFLPWSAAAGEPAAGAPTRLARALEAARAELELCRRRGDRLRWLRVRAGLPEASEGESPPDAWLRPPRAPEPSPPWAAYDREGTLWVSDDADGVEPRRAGACLAGGAAVHGAVAALGPRRLVWGPAGLELEAALSARPRLRSAAGAPESLERLLAAWSAAREVERVGEGAAGEVELELALAGGTGAGSSGGRGARDGWTWTLEGPRTRPRGAAWLADGRGALVAWSPGRIELAGSRFAEPRGDPAAFAASWAELLDTAALPVAGVVALGERLGAGAPRRSPPSPAPAGQRRAAAGWLGACLAGLAALAALAALVAARPRGGLAP